jgi:hypothetical protein
MMGWAITVLLVLWVGASMKTSRPDGSLVARLHPYRRIMGFIMPGRNESVVYFDSYVNADRLLAYLDEARKRFDVDLTHCLAASALLTMLDNPSMNRFVAGRRLYQRRQAYVTFSMKRKAMDRAAKLATVKVAYQSGETFREFCERVNRLITVERSGERTYADKEFDLFNALPRPLLRAGVTILKLLDYYNLLPASYIENDPLYTSMFVANLGSLGMAPGYHHLYEYGTCSVFTMAGKIEDLPVVEDGRVVARKTLHLRFTYDERMDDGLNAHHGIRSYCRALEQPYETFGCLAADASDARPLGARAALSEERVAVRAAG